MGDETILEKWRKEDPEQVGNDEFWGLCELTPAMVNSLLPNWKLLPWP